MSLAERLEEAAEALPEQADAIRPANGDPQQLLSALGPEPARAVLGWLLEHAPEDAGELGAAWLDESTGAAVLGGLDEESLSKPGRKVLRKLLHAARSRGLVLPEAPARPAKVARLPDLEQQIDEAYVSPLDPRGSRLVYLVESSPGGGARVFEALIDHDRGVVDFQVYRAGRRQVRDFVRDVTGRSGSFAAVAAEPASVRALIARAASRHPASRPFPKSFSEWRTRLGRGSDPDSGTGTGAAATPGDQRLAEWRESGALAADAGAVDRLADAVRARELGPWPPRPERLEALVGALRERIERERDAVATSLAVWAREAVGPLYAGDEAARLAECFAETAHVYARRGDEALARACAATSAALLAGEGGESPAVRALAETVAEAIANDLARSLGGGAEASAPGDREHPIPPDTAAAREVAAEDSNR